VLSEVDRTTIGTFLEYAENNDAIPTILKSLRIKS
jgi:hypothetical protein